MNLYRFVEAEKAGQEGNVAVACQLLEVSRSAYYEWSKCSPSLHQATDSELEGKIRQIHKASRGTYGSPRITRELRDQGICVGKKRVARLMVRAGLAGRCKRRLKRTTIRDPLSEKEAVDLIRRNFGPGVRELNTAFCGDISYIRTWEGWLYLASVIDLSSRRLVGYAMAEHMRDDLVIEALQMAIEQRRPGPGLIFHSDRGSQYTSQDFRKLLKDNHIVQSLSRVGQCWDNSVAEAFFSTLKEELIYRISLPTRAYARRVIFEWIEVFYNRVRRHSSLDYLSPAEYERRRSSTLTRTQAA